MIKNCECPGCIISRSGNGYQPCHNLPSDLSLPETAKKDPLEKEVEARFHKKIVKMGGFDWKFASINHKGVSDRIVLYHGRVIFVEMKRSTGKMSPLQEKFKIKVLENGGEFACVYGHAGTDAFIAKLKWDDQWWVSGFNFIWAIIGKFTGDYK